MISVISVKTVPEDKPSMLAEFMFLMQSFFLTTFYSDLQDTVSKERAMTCYMDGNYQRCCEICNGAARHHSLKSHFSTQPTEATHSKRVEAETTCRSDERTGHWEEKQGKKERGRPANMNFVTWKHADEHKGATHK